MVICLERGADLHTAQPLPLTVSCSSKIQIGFTFVVPAHLGSPGQRAIKRVCMCVFMIIFGTLSFHISLISHTRTHARTHMFNGPLSRTTRVSQYQKGKTNLHFTEARDSEWQWHQLGHICKSAPCSRQINTQHPPLSF